MGRNANRTMIFEPALSGSGSRCTCNTIDTVTIVISRFDKHALPVDFSCAYSHRFMIQSALVQNTRNPGKLACNFADGTPVTNYDELSQCMHAGNCDIVDDWLRINVLRDPRPAVVSVYFRLQVLNGPNLETLEAFVAREPPIMCQWLAIRYVLFSEIIPHQSMEVWYIDAIANPLEWHYNWFDYIGLQLPHNVVKATANAAAANNFGFSRMAVDVHQGEQAWIEAGHRRFDDYVRIEVAAAAAFVLRTWLPPVLLQRFGVAPWE